MSDSEEKLEKKAEEALKQIEHKKYYMELEKRGIKEMTFLGVAFYKKLLKIKMYTNDKNKIKEIEKEF